MKSHDHFTALRAMGSLGFASLFLLLSCSRLNPVFDSSSTHAELAFSQKNLLTLEGPATSYQGIEAGYPIITVTPGLICQDLQFINGEGVLLTGTKDCSAAAATDYEELKAENIKAGILIGEVTGIDPEPIGLAECVSDGQTDCKTTASRPAIDSSRISSSCITGSTFAGIAGTLIAEGHPTCSTDGQAGCAVLGPTFAAALIAGAADRIISGQTLAGVSGLVLLPSPNLVLTGTSYGALGTGIAGSLSLPLAAYVKTGTAPYGEASSPLTPSYSPDFPSLANVRGGDSVDGQAGTLADCSGGHQANCFATTNFKTMDLATASTDTGLTASNSATLFAGAANFEFWDATGLRHSVAGDANITAAKILSGETIFGVTGSVIPAPAACSVNGGQTCVTSGSYFAATACSANGSNCFLPAYAASTQALKAVSFDAVDAGKAAFLSTLTLAGIQGTLGDCTGAHQSGCIATANWKTLDLSSASAMTDLSNSNFNVTIKSSGNFEFWDSTGTRHQVAGDVDLVAANIKSGELIFGVTGTMTAAPPTCAADGEVNCLVDGSSFAAAAIVGGADKILAGQTHAGITGNISLPAAGKVLAAISYGVAGTGRTGTLTLPLAADVKTGSGAYGEPGSQLTPAYSPDFPAVANVRASDTVDGATGTMNDCTAANQSGCVATTTFKTIDLSAASSMVDLTSGTFNATIAGTGNFEFWDSTGSRHQVAGDADLTAANILNTTNIFGVSGSVIATPPDCTAANQSGCVATSTFKTMNLSSFGVATGLTAANLNATIKAVANFEFWDALGVHHTVAADSDLAAANIANLVNIWGTPGTAVLEAHAPCSASNQSACVATSTYKTMDLTSASGGITDLIGSTFNATLATAADFEFWDSAGARYEVSGDADLTAANILSGFTIFGASGTVTASPANCATNGSQNCVATGSYFSALACSASDSACYLPSYVATSQPLKAISYDTINAGKASIRDSLSLGGITGTLIDCSAANQAGCVATDPFRTLDLSLATGGMTDLTGSNFNSTLAMAANFEFWDSTGARHQVSGTSNISVGNVKSGVTIFGTTGQYPSATYPLTSASGTADLNAATFTAKVKAATAFEYWDSDGTYQAGAGDADLVETNIANAVDIFGVTGTQQTGLVAPDGWDIRAGTTINGVTGLSKLNCRNFASSTVYDMGLPQAATVTTGTPGTINLIGHGFAANQTVRIGGSTAPTGLTLSSTTYYVRNPTANAFELSATSGGASIDITSAGTGIYVSVWSDGTAQWWDTLDNYNTNLAFPTQRVSGWSSDTACAKEIWVDLTSGGCTSNAKDCVMKDRISGLQWSESYPVSGSAPSAPNKNWFAAVAICDALSFGGQTDWRLPTQMEMEQAYLHGIRNVGYAGGTARPGGDTVDNNDYFFNDIDSSGFWNSTTVSWVGGNAFWINLHWGNTGQTGKNSSFQVVCVR